MAKHKFKRLKMGDKSYTLDFFYIFDYMSMVHACREILAKSILEYTGVLDWHKISERYRKGGDFPTTIAAETVSIPKMIAAFMDNCKKIFDQKKTIIMNQQGGWQIFESRDSSWVETEEIVKDSVVFN